MALLLALVCAAAYLPTLLPGEFFFDDRPLIAENPVLRAGLSGLPRLFTVGFWEAALGDWAPVKQYRPFLMTTFLLQTASTGFSPLPMHAVNLGLHWLVSLLFWLVLKRRGPPEAAAAAALVFAALPVHVEAVALLMGRSEVLAAALMLGAWLLLDGEASPRGLAGGAAAYAAALLTKESSLLFLPLLALSDWVFLRRAPWSRGRRGLHALLWGLSAAYLLARAAVLAEVVQGGVPYFPQGRLVAALTFARFLFRHYAVPALTGTGLCSDFARPFFGDSDPALWTAWLPALALAAGLCAASRSLVRERAVWAFWLLAPLAFLLPTSNLVFPLDTIGAERFLYMPSLGLAAGLGALYARAAAARPRAALACGLLVLGWYLCATFARGRDWSTRLAFLESAVACNPVSARARSSLAGALLEAGRPAEGEAQLLEALRLDPALPSVRYNVARLAWERGRTDEAEAFARRALAGDPRSAEALTLLALAQEKRGRADEAMATLRRALAVRPWEAAAEFNLARLHLMRGESGEARLHFTRYLELAPDDPEAAAVVARLSAERGSAR